MALAAPMAPILAAARMARINRIAAQAPIPAQAAVQAQAAAQVPIPAQALAVAQAQAVAPARQATALSFNLPPIKKTSGCALPRVAQPVFFHSLKGIML